MNHRSAPIRLIAVFVLALVGCSTDASEPSRDPSADGPGVTVPPPTALETPLESDEAAVRACTSRVNAAGLVCSRCPGDAPGAKPECLPAQCNVLDHCLECTDPKGRVARDCSMDYELAPAGGIGGSPNAEFGFGSCHFLFGIPKASGTTCHYPGANSCEITVDGPIQCMTCTHPDGSSNGECLDAPDTLPDPLINRPDDLPAPGFCVNDLSPDGKIECTTCTKDDLSATRSCHYPGIVACNILTGPVDPAGKCSLLCTFEDSHQELLCDTPRGVRPTSRLLN